MSVNLVYIFCGTRKRQSESSSLRSVRACVAYCSVLSKTVTLMRQPQQFVIQCVYLTDYLVTVGRNHAVQQLASITSHTKRGGTNEPTTSPVTGQNQPIMETRTKHKSLNIKITRNLRRGAPARRKYNSLVSHSTTGSSMSKKLLVDVDSGVDDAQAIMLALAAPNVKLLGITCVHGNTTVENVCKNTLRVLQACNKLEIPVFKGAALPILGNSISAGHFHGEDGFGDAPDPNAPGLDLVQAEDAVSAMIRIVNENPGEVTLVATGPLTNLALAVRLDPSLPSKLKGLYIMGGNTESRGNTTVCAEFNFAADPEAAYIVLNEYRCPTYLACWEFTCYSKLSWEFCDAWLAQDTEKARFMAQIFRHSIEASRSKRFQKEFVAGSGFISCDSYAMAAAIDDAFITESDHYPVSVELTGTYTRGMMILDTLDLLKKTHKTFIMKKVDMEKFKQMMMDALK